ncbi:Hsp20 family protein [Nitratifractor sp.]
MNRANKILAGLLAGGSLALASAAMTPAQNAPVDPFAQMDRIFKMQMQQMEIMRRQMDQLFQNFERNFQSPSIMKMPILVHSSGVLSTGLRDKGDHYELAIKVGDLKNSKVDISTDNGMLTVKVTEKKKVEKQQGNYGKIISYTNSSSVQSFTLPSDADAVNITAEQKDNTILITIPKKKGKASKVIPIQNSESNTSTQTKASEKKEEKN